MGGWIMENQICCMILTILAELDEAVSRYLSGG